MKNICLSLLLLGAPAFADETSQEGVLVTGSRIPFESVGVISIAGSPIDSTGHGCAEPNCGSLPSDPGSSGGYTSHAAKGQRNKQAKQKVQQKGQAVTQPIKNTKSQSEQSLWVTINQWLSRTTITHDTYSESESPNGKILRNGSCTHIDLSEQKGPNPCVEKKIDVEKVLKSNGELTNQLLLSFVVYEACYYEKKCGPNYITFIAENQKELNFLLNDAIGENYF